MEYADGFTVIPANAGIQVCMDRRGLDSRVRGNDKYIY